MLALLSFHVYLLSVNQTTYERVKKFFWRMPNSPNPNHLGNFFSNFRARWRQNKRSDSVITLLVDIIGARKSTECSLVKKVAKAGSSMKKISQI